MAPNRSKGQRAPWFHAIVATVVLGGFFTFCACHKRIKALVSPLAGMAEDTFAARICLWVLLSKIPEFFPIVICLAGFIVFCPPTEMWRYLVTSVLPGAVASLGDYGEIVALGGITFVLFVTVYWGNGLLLLILEQNLFPEWIARLRIQTLKPSSRPELQKLVKNLAFTTFCILPFVLPALIPCVRIQPELPGPWETFCHVLFSIISNEIIFYYGHWLMHANKFLYTKVHKIHHEFKAPHALAAIYCHPVEFIVSDILPLGFGVLYLNCHLYTGLIWLLFAILGTQTHHCGIRWPWIDFFSFNKEPQPNYHDFHHEKFTVNYGSLGWLDFLHGTGWDWERDGPAAAKAA